MFDDDDDDDRPRDRLRKAATRERAARPALKLPPVRSKEMTTAVVLSTPPTTRISKLKEGSVQSILGDSVEEIHQLLERKSNESAISLTQKVLLQTVLDAIPLAENTIRQTEGARGVYQLNSLITSVREIMLDMQSTQDKGAIASMLIEKVIRPIWMDIAMILVKEDAMVTNKVMSSCSDHREAAAINREREDSLKRVSNILQKKYEEAKEQVESFLKM